MRASVQRSKYAARYGPDYYHMFRFDHLLIIAGGKLVFFRSSNIWYPTVRLHLTIVASITGCYLMKLYLVRGDLARPFIH